MLVSFVEELPRGTRRRTPALPEVPNNHNYKQPSHKRRKHSVLSLSGALDLTEKENILNKSTQHNDHILTKVCDQTQHWSYRNSQKSKAVIKVLSWNLRSLNNVNKVHEFLKHQADINLIQEIWNPSDDLLMLLGKNIEMKRRSDKFGGSLLHYDEKKLPISRNQLTINEDCQISKHIIHNNKYVNICSLYIPKISKKALKEVFNNSQKMVPESELPYLLLMGDWNINLMNENKQETIMLKELCNQMGLIISHNGPLRKGNTIDFAVHGREINLTNWQSFESSSDHNIMTFEMSI